MGVQIVNRETGLPVSPPEFTQLPVATDDVDVLSPPLQWPEGLVGDDDLGDGVQGRDFACENHSWQREMRQ